MKSLSWIILICLMSFSACKKEDNQPLVSDSKNTAKPKVRLTKVQGKYTLLVNNEPFYIKGAGLEFGQISAVAQHGGNSFRTWRTENGKQTAKEVLDEAQKHGLMVTMGIEVARERHGFDYNDETAVQKQFERIKKEVLAIKDHPALLIWAIGNELNLRATNPKVWDAVNDLSKMIHELDGNHLTTSTLAGISQHDINLLKERCTDLDLLSFQLYGKIEELPQLIKDFGWEGPYMVTEWGATGHWEVPKTSWDVPIEENSTVKAANYLKRYRIGIESDTTQCIGSYVFLWGQKQERTPTWYGIFLEDGKETESVDVMHYIWNSSWPSNRTPKIESFVLDEKTAYDNVILAKGKSYRAKVKIKDMEEEVISYSWEILPESTDLGDGGDYETRPEPLEGHFVNVADGELEFRAPKAGSYRLFVYADDGNNHAATANIPFKIN